MCRLSGMAVLLTALIVAVATGAQAPEKAEANPPSQQRVYPAPTNLKVLPKNLTRQQVHQIMEQWKSSLGIDCNSCHAEDRERVGPNNRPLLDFTADSKPMKGVARTMYIMTEEINTKYVASIDSSGAPVTCGTCHRGHLGPEPFVMPSEARPRAPEGPTLSSDKQ